MDVCGVERRESKAFMTCRVMFVLRLHVLHERVFPNDNISFAIIYNIGICDALCVLVLFRT